MEITRRIVAAVIVNNKNQVLLCKRSSNDNVYPGVWHMPGGGIEKGETLFDSISRELKEEMDLSVVKVGPDIEVSEEFEVDGGLHHVDFYPVKVIGEIKLNPENDDYAWVVYKEFENYLEEVVFQINKDALEKTIELGFYSTISTDK